MNRQKTILFITIEVFLFLILGVALFILSLSPSSERPEAPLPTPSFPSTPAGTEMVDQPYPPPIRTVPVGTETLEPTREFILIGTDEYATPTELLPTFTPYPTPTLRPGATPTPLPLVQPVRDAAGEILYIARHSDEVDKNEKEISTIAMDAAGMAKSAPALLWLFNVPDGYLYPSPDGSYMVIVVDTVGGAVHYLLDVNSGLVELLLGGQNIDTFFGWYPDSRHVLIGPGGGLWLADIHNSNLGEQVPLAVPAYMAIDAAAASPDGQKVVYYSSNDVTSTAGVWMVNADGRDAHLLFESTIDAGNFTWSPDGSQISLLGGQMVMNADGSNLRMLGNFHSYGYPRWSPDSRGLAIVVSTSSEMIPYSNWDEDVFKSSDILLVDVQSGDSRSLLLDGNTGNIDPAWSPDGKQIVFVSNRSGAPEIWTVNVDATDLRQLTSDGKYKRFPFWGRP